MRRPWPPGPLKEKAKALPPIETYVARLLTNLDKASHPTLDSFGGFYGKILAKVNRLSGYTDDIEPGLVDKLAAALTKALESDAAAVRRVVEELNVPTACCPGCQGRGRVRRPRTVAPDARQKRLGC